MRISQLDPADTSGIQQAAEALVAGFVVLFPAAWPDLASVVKHKPLSV